MRRPPGSFYRLLCSRPLFACLLPLPCPILIFLFCTHLKTNFPLQLSSSREPLFSFFIFLTLTLAGLSTPSPPLCVHCCGSCPGPCNGSALPLSHTSSFYIFSAKRKIKDWREASAMESTGCSFWFRPPMWWLETIYSNSTRSYVSF